MNAWFAATQQNDHHVQTRLKMKLRTSLCVMHVAESKPHLSLQMNLVCAKFFKALKQGGMTVILPDHTPNVGGDMIEYFGLPLEQRAIRSAKLI